MQDHQPIQTLGRTDDGCPGSLEAELYRFIGSKEFPCVGAKSALNRKRLTCVELDALGTQQSAEELVRRLRTFAAEHPDPGLEPVSFAAIFRQQVGDEVHFHELLWQQLQQVHEVDCRTSAWAPGVGCDPAAADFSFSVAGTAYFVVGMHPRSPRLARRTPRPTLVFNFHEQFEALKAAGRYQKMQSAIRERDVALQGDINPALADFGQGSEARQYSGHLAGKCPFHANSKP